MLIYIAQILKRRFILNYFSLKCGNLFVSLLKESKNLITADTILLLLSQRSYLFTYCLVSAIFQTNFCTPFIAPSFEGVFV